jgi:cytoskeletal protein RodZ
MTFGDRTEVKRAKVGTKVLAFGCAIFAVLGSFWTIVWFIRSYVEPPRVTISPALALAARDSTPAALPAPAKPAPPAKAETANPTVQPATAESVPASPPRVQAAPADQSTGTSSIADRWLPIAPTPEPPPAPAAQSETTASIPAPAPAEPLAEEIAESSVPAISGPAPLPRRKPIQTAAVRARTVEPPLPRPRPDGPAPQSVWTAVPTADDRYQAGQ